MSKRYWLIKIYTPFWGEDKIAYYVGTSENKMHEFAQEITGNIAAEWWDDGCGMSEDDYFECFNYISEEISYESYRENCGY